MGDRLPSGTFTFLFADIDGSTALLGRLGDEYAGALDQQRAIVRAAVLPFTDHLETEGDGCLVAFSSANDAVRAALDAQIALCSQPWDAGHGARVRMGLHTGEARRAGDGYIGLPLHQAKRIRDGAHGGQIALSRTTRDLAGSDIPDGATIDDLGEFRVPDFEEPQRIYQLSHPALPRGFPALRLERAGSRLPAQATRFVGRSRELAQLRELLSTTRLLTIVGPGGAGKTRLALEVAGELVRTSPTAVWLVDLAPSDNGSLVVPAIAAAVYAAEIAGRPLVDAVSSAIGGSDALLLLDNCEHVVESCGRAAVDLLERCPGLTILATSREPLAVAAEVQWSTPPMALPDPDVAVGAAQIERYDALRLFCDRARLVRPDFAPNDASTPSVIRICRRLDGIALAIELAAARIAHMGVEDIAERLDERFDLLVSKARDVPERQRTLRAAIDWSYDMLSPAQRLVFARLGCFTGSFDLDAADAVCADGPIAATDVLGLVVSLISRSLVVAEHRDDRSRYRLLDMIRDYALSKLLEDEAGARAARVRHLGWCLTTAEQAAARLRSDPAGALATLESDIDDMRAALRFALDSESHAEEAVRLATALSGFWEHKGLLTEGRAWLGSALARPTDPALRVQALLRAATLARVQGDFTATRSSSEEALELVRDTGDESALASSLSVLGSVAGAEASSVSGDSISLRRQLRVVEGITASMRDLGAIAWQEGDHDAVRALHEESLSIARKIGDQAAIAESLVWLGNVACATEDWTQAQTKYEEGLELHRSLHHRRHEADDLSNLGLVAQARDDIETARELHTASLSLRRELDHRRGIAISCLNLGELLHEAGDIDAARDLFEESRAIGDELDDERIKAAAGLRLAPAPPEPTASSSMPSPAEVIDVTGSLVHEGEYWTVTYEGRTSRLKDSKGLHHLAELLRHPQRELHVIDLVGAVEGTSPSGRALGFMSADHLDRLVVDADPFGNAGEILDAEAKAAYKSRLDELRAELDEAESWGDPVRAARAKEEYDAITDQLAAAVGLGGRDRKVSSASERARWSVSRSVKGALQRIANADPELGRHFSVTIRTGTYCSYSPDPRVSVAWAVR